MMWRDVAFHVTIVLGFVINAVVTCELILFTNNFEITSVFYFTCSLTIDCGYVWNKTMK